MIFKRTFALVLMVSMLLTGCSLLENNTGTLQLDDNTVSSVLVKNTAPDTTVTVQDRDSIQAFIRLLNTYTLENGTEPVGTGEYELTLSFTDGTTKVFALSGTDTLITEGLSYSVDTGKLVSLAEKTECATLTDEQLLERIFRDDYLASISITNDRGDISLDKIAGIPDQCPALFELLGRTSFLESVGSYGLDKLKEMAGSADEAVREQAEKLGEIFSNLIPSLKEEIRKIIG